MRITNFAKRTTAAVLAALMCLTTAPGTVLAAGGEALRAALAGSETVVSASKDANGGITNERFPTNTPYQDVPLLNAQTMNNREFLNELVYKENGPLNAGSMFTMTGYNSADMYQPPATMAAGYNHTYQAYNDDGNWYTEFRMYLPGTRSGNGKHLAFYDLIQSGQISFNFSGELIWKKHSHLLSGRKHGSEADLTVVRISSPYGVYAELTNDTNTQKQKTWYSMETGWTRLPTNVRKNLTVYFTHSMGDRCWCGDSGVKKPVMTFADNVYPTVTNVTVKDSKYYYKAGEQFTFTVYFSEPIRKFTGETQIYADKSTRINLSAYNRVDMTSVDAYAALSGMGENYLQYTYTAPSDGTDIIITGLAPKERQTDALLNTGNSLRMYTNNGKYEDFYVGGRYIRVNAEFTDLAGNGIDERWTGYSFPHEIHVDTSGPELSTVTLTGTMMQGEKVEGYGEDSQDDWPDDIDRSQVFAGVGDWLTFHARFNEELSTFSGQGAASGSDDAQHFTATLNVLNEDGTPVKITGDTINSVQQGGGNWIPASDLVFTAFQIQEGMKPDTTYPGPIKIVDITCDAPIMDMCGNEIETVNGTDGKIPVPEQQEWLDAIAPTVSLTKESGDAETQQYTFKIVANEGQYEGFNTGEARLYQSGIVGVGQNWQLQQGGLAYILGILSGARYQYQLNNSPTPDDSAWRDMTGSICIGFVQPDAEEYLHIRSAQDGVVAEPLIGEIRAVVHDYAGNSAEQVYRFEDNGIPVALKDNVPPTASASFDVVTNGVRAKKLFKDAGYLEEAWYKIVVNQHADADADDPNKPTEDSIRAENHSGEGWTQEDRIPGRYWTTIETWMQEPTTCDVNTYSRVYVCMYTRDKSGNETYAVESTDVDLRMPSYSVELPGVPVTDLAAAAPEDPSSSQALKASKMDYSQAGINDAALFVTLNPTQMTLDGATDCSLTVLVDQIKEVDGAANNIYTYAGLDNLLQNIKATDGPIKGVGESDNYIEGFEHFEQSYAMGTVTGEVLNDIFTDFRHDLTEQIVEKFKNYYGEVEVYVTLASMASCNKYGEGENEWFYTKDSAGKISSTKLGTFKMRVGGETEDTINKADFGIPTASNGEALYDSEKAEFDLRVAVDKTGYMEEGATAFKTLEGVTVPFTVGNNRVEGWGVEDIDFEKSKAVAYYAPMTDIDSIDAYVPTEFEMALDADTEAKQELVFPVDGGGIDYQNGVYKVKVTLVSKSHPEKPEEFWLENYCFKVNTYEPDENGGFKSVYIVDGRTLTTTSDHRDRFSEWAIDSDYSGKSIDSYTIPVIDNIEYGQKVRDYFFPFVTYQTKLANDDGDKTVDGGGPLMVLLAWLEDETGEKKVISEDTPYYEAQGTLNTASGEHAASFEVLNEEKIGYTFGFQVTTVKSKYDGLDNDGLPVDPARNLDIAPGQTVTLCVQEAYSNGEKSSVKKIRVTAPVDTGDYPYDYDREEFPDGYAMAASVSPNVDVSWYMAQGSGQNVIPIPSSTVEITVNDISSLNGISDIFFAKGYQDQWEKTDGYYFDAEIKGEEGGRKLLAIDGKTTLGDEETAEFLKDLMNKDGEYTMRGSVLVAVDNNYNMTVAELTLLDAWDPFAPVVTGEPAIDSANGTYTVALELSDQYGSIDLDGRPDGMTLYISSVDPSLPVEDDDEEQPEVNTDPLDQITETIAIPWGDLPRTYYMDEVTYSTPYDGSTMNRPGVYGIFTTSGWDGYAGSQWGFSDDSGNSFFIPDPPPYMTADMTITGALPDYDVFIYATDELGNMSDVITIPGGASVVQPMIDGDPERSEDDGTLSVGFTQAVSIKSIVDPAGAEIELPDGSEKLTALKTGLPVFKDGTYTVVYRDIFGNEYTQELVVALDEDWLQYDYSMTPSTLTNGNVEFTLAGTNDTDVFSIRSARVVYDDGSEGTAAVDRKNVTATLDRNGCVEVTFGHGEDSAVKKFPIKNIDKLIANVEVVFEYGSDDVYEFDEDGKKQENYETGGYQLKPEGFVTSGLVTAVVLVNDEDQPDEELVGETRYTFPNRSTHGETHDFTFTDAAGNEGHITATLPYDIVLPTPTRMAGVSVTGMLLRSDDSTIGSSSDMTFLLGYEAGDAGKLFMDGTQPVKAFKDRLTVTADVDAEIRVVPYDTEGITAATPDQSAAMEGVSLSNKTIEVTKNASFKIIVVEDIRYYNDAQDEATYSDPNSDRSEQKVFVIPVTVENLIGIGPVSATSMRISNFVRRVYFEPLDNTDLTLTNDQSEITLDEENGKWYTVIRAGVNKTFTFTFRDSVGNEGSYTANIEDLPDSDEVAVSGAPRWWPYDGKDQTKLSEKPVNYDVTVQVEYNMMIGEAALYSQALADEAYLVDTEANGITINVTMNLVTVTFGQNYFDTAWLYVRGETEKEKFVEIAPVTTIDKDAPVVEHDDPAEPGRTATVTFIPNEPVICQELPKQVENGDTDSAYYDAANPLTVTFTANGEYTYTFRDKAGNKTVVSGEITNIDRDAPVVSFSLDGTGEGSDWASFAQAQGDAVWTLEEFYIRAVDDRSETVTCKLQNQRDMELTSGEWAQVRIDRTLGGFALSVTDRARNGMTVELTGIRVEDTTPPVLAVAPQNLSISEDDVGDAEKLGALLKSGDTVADDSDKYDYAQKVSWDYSPKTLPKTPGEYTVTYTATDRNGNTSKAVRYVRVYSSTSIMVRVKGEGDSEFTSAGYMSTVIVGSGAFIVEVSNLENDGNGNYKPCQVYIKRGFKTAWQMKNGSELIPASGRTTLPAGDGFTSEYSVSGSGYYTLYIIAQDRTQYLTYLYIEQ